MKCSLFDLTCHAQSAAQGAAWQVQNAIYEWWASVGLVNKGLIVLGLWALVLYLTRGVISLVHRVGGWKAVAGYAAGALGGVIWLFLWLQPKKPRRPDHAEEAEGRPRRQPRFRVPPPRKKGRREWSPPESLIKG